MNMSPIAYSQNNINCHSRRGIKMNMSPIIYSQNNINCYFLRGIKMNMSHIAYTHKITLMAILLEA